jgi:hypothetical protein
LSLAIPISKTSASEIAMVEDCKARYLHTMRRYLHALLPTDTVAADVSSAVHDALMIFHRQLEQELRSGTLPSIPGGRARLRMLVDQQLRRKRLSNTYPDVAKRIARLQLGLDRTADLVLDDMPFWARDPRTQDALVWVEGTLDHGRGVHGVQLQPGYIVRTRPDVIGIRPDDRGTFRVVVRDFKAKGQIVDPQFDTGILLRGIWAALELMDPRCEWFLSGRTIDVDTSSVQLETINLLHGSSSEFTVRRIVSVAQLMQERDRFVPIIDEMNALKQVTDAGQVLASPTALCLNWCPFLGYCQAGQAHVRKYFGEEALLARLAEAEEVEA